MARAHDVGTVATTEGTAPTRMPAGRASDGSTAATLAALARALSPGVDAGDSLPGACRASGGA